MITIVNFVKYKAGSAHDFADDLYIYFCHLNGCSAHSFATSSERLV